MDDNQISLISLGIAFIPVCVAIIILKKARTNYTYNIYAIVRMIVQLIAIGYVLSAVFSTNNSIVVLLIIITMLILSSSIAMRTMIKKDIRTGYRAFMVALVAILFGAGVPLVFLTQYVLHIIPWYNPSSIIPLAGMLLFNALNAISLAMDRYQSELSNNTTIIEAEKKAMSTAMIPITNSFLAAGIVSLPGFMTGQILSGVDPLIAVRYQIIILCMIFSSQVFSVFIFLQLFKRKKPRQIARQIARHIVYYKKPLLTLP